MNYGRRSYAWGYKRRDAAEDAIDTMIADGEMSPCERPEVSSYRTERGKRYRVTIIDHTYIY